MQKIIKIDGMSCSHCSGTVQKALSALDGVSGVEVNLDTKNAVVTLSQDVSNETLTSAVTEAGYEVTSII